MSALFATFMVGAAIKAFASYEAGMERLRTQTGASQREVGLMTGAVEKMAIAIGNSPHSLSEALYHIESAGFRGKKALNALEIAAKGAQIGGAELTSTTTAMTAVMVAGFKGVNTLGKAMGELNATVGAGDMTFEDLNDALGTGLLATIKTLGLQIKDMGAALAVLGDNNMRGSAAATRLRMGLMMLVHPSTTATKTMEALGLSQLQLANDLRKPDGLLVMLKDLKAHLHGFTKSEQAYALAEIFGGGRNSAAMLTLINQMGRLETKYKAIEKGGNKFNADWKATAKTLEHFLGVLRAIAEVALIKFGEAIVLAVRVGGGFAKWLSGSSVGADALKGALMGLGALLLVDLIPALIAFTIEAVASGIAVIAAWAPVLLPVMAIGAAIYLLIAHFGLLEKAATAAWGWIEKAAMTAWTWIKGHWPLLASILLFPIVGPIGIIVALFHKQLWGAMVAVWDWIKNVWHHLGGWLAWPFEQLWDIAKKVIDWVEKLFGTAVKKLEGMVTKGPLGTLMKVGGSIAGGIGKGISAVGGFLGLADGGLVGSSGVYEVGERGRELVYLPAGSYVQPNHEVGQSVSSVPRELVVPLTVQLGRKVLAQQIVRTGLEQQACK
ncbi:MAG: phage tail tape measure protein [Solirubrobacteraceae bacterium]